MTDSLTSSVSPSQRENNFTTLPFRNVIQAAAGWGHSAIVTGSYDDKNKLYVCGRPYDFQNLLRMYRMPSMVRRMVAMQSLLFDRDGSSGVLGNMVNTLFRNVESDGQEDKYQRAIFPEFREIVLPNGDVPLSISRVNGMKNQKTLAASAGLTAIVGETGKLYTFGLNQRGQCGIGEKTVHHVWEPQPVILKSGEDVGRVSGEVLEGITDVDLGLQHGLALDSEGKLFGWGKGARGQLGKSAFKTTNFDDGKESTVDVEFGAIPIDDFEVATSESRSALTGNDASVKTMSAGWNHSAVITNSNHAFVWGKNALAEVKEGILKPVDLPAPTLIKGLPANQEIQDISCGSHHTSILMEDGSVYAIGISTDSAEPIGERAVQILPPGLIDAPIVQFTSHFDRTTIVAGNDEKQILEVQLWSTEELRDGAVFEPEWVEKLPNVKMVERGWLHTLVITGDEL